jgi:hypothetical protein
MNKILPLIGVAVATGFVGYAGVQFSGIPITDPADDAGKAAQVRPKAPQRTAADDEEPPYKALIRCINDLDDLLDSIVNPATFQTVKPLMLKRVRRHVAEMEEREHGMGELSRDAAREMQQAIKRHAASLARANSVAPGVNDFFSQHLAAVLNPK